MTRFSKTLLRLRHERNLSQDSLALAIGVCAGSVRAWEHRRRMPSLRNLLRLSRVLKVPLDELV